jgi:molybdate transport system substrate-binding protein
MYPIMKAGVRLKRPVLDERGASPAIRRSPARVASSRFLACLVAGLACFIGATPAHAAVQPIAVSAAASLRDVLQTVNAAYEKRNNEHVSAVYGPSFRLASDIARGAVPDVFISADTASVAYLETRNLVRGDVLMELVRNRLVVVARDGYTAPREARKSASAALSSMATLALPDPRQHPAGKFGQAALVKLGLWDGVGAKARTTTSIRAVLDLVANGEVDGAIVYRSSALREPRTHIVQILPETAHPPITYTVAVTTHGRGWPAVSAYVSYIRSQAALDIFERYGFQRDAPWKK